MLLWDTFFAAGQAQLGKGRHKRAEELIKSALGEAEAFKIDDPRRLRTVLTLARIYQESGRTGEAAPLLERASDEMAQAPGLPAVDKAAVVEAQLVQLDLTEDSAKERIAFNRQLVDIWGGDGEPSRESLAETLVALAHAVRDLEGESAVRDCLDRALETRISLNGAKSVEVADLLALLAESHSRSHQFEEAEQCCRRVLAIRETELGPEHPKVAASLEMLSSVLESAGSSDEALSLLERAASIPGERRVYYYLTHVETQLRCGLAAESLANLITLEKGGLQTEEQVARYELLLLRAYRGVDDKVTLAEQAHRLTERLTFPDFVRQEGHLVLGELCDPHDLEGREKALAAVVELDDEEQPSSIALLTRFADLARSAQDKERAAAYYDRAISARSALLDPSDPGSVNILLELGNIQERRRLLPDATTSWEKSLESLRRHSGQVSTPSEERELRLLLVQNLAQVYLRQRRWDRAEQAWRSLVRSSAAGSLSHLRGRLGLAQVYTEREQNQKALELLEADDQVSPTESEHGRALYDSAFMLRLLNLAQMGSIEIARNFLDRRFEQRGALHLSSTRELYAAINFARAAREDELFAEISAEFASRDPSDAEEQLLMARFYAAVGHQNSRFLGSDKMCLDLRPSKAFEHAVNWAIEANGELDMLVADLFEERARASVAEGAWEEAEMVTRKTLDIRRVLHGETSSTLLSSLQRIGELQLGKGQLEAASESLTEALSLGDRHLTPSDVHIRELLRSLIEAERRLGHFQKSREYFTRLLKLYGEFEELGAEEKLGDLLRGIRLLLGDGGDHRVALGVYLDEATELAAARGGIAELSLAFCFGQKARLILSDEPDEAIGLLRRQATVLKDREESAEFLPDQLLLARLLLYRGQPRGTLVLLEQIDPAHGDSLRKAPIRQEYNLCETQAYWQLGETQETAQRLEPLIDSLQAELETPAEVKAEILSLQLFLGDGQPDLFLPESIDQAYAELDTVLIELGAPSPEPQHVARAQWDWQLAKLRFETRRLSDEAGFERLKDHCNEIRGLGQEVPSALADALAELAQKAEFIGHDEEALGYFSEAQSYIERAGDLESLQRARIVASIARISERLGEDEQALGAYRESVSDLKTHLGHQHRDLIPQYLGLGRLGRMQSDLESAESALKQATLIVEVLKEQLELKVRSEVFIDMANLLSEMERHFEAKLRWQAVKELWEEAGDLLPTRWLSPFTEAHIAAGSEVEALPFFLHSLPFRLSQGEDSLLLSTYNRWLELIARTGVGEQGKEQAELLVEVRELLSSVTDGDPGDEVLCLWSGTLVGYARLHEAQLLNYQSEVNEDLAEALKIRETHLGEESPEVGEVLSLQADLAVEASELSVAENCLTRALNINESSFGPDSWEVAQVLLKLANVYFTKQKFSPTEAVLQRTLELCGSLLGEEDERWIEVLHLHGKLDLELGRPGDAQRSLSKALALCEAQEKEPTVPLLIAAGRANLLTQNSELALTLLLEAEKHLPEDPEAWDANIEDVLITIGELLLAAERYEEANARLLPVQVQQEKRLGYGDPNLVRVYSGLAMTAVGMNDLETAEERLEIAHALQEEDLFQPVDLYSMYLELTEVHLKAGREERAGELLEENLQRCRDANVAEESAELAGILAGSYQRRGENTKAEASFRECIACLEKALKKAASGEEAALREKLLVPLESLANLLAMDRRYTEAEELTRQRLKNLELLEPGEFAVAGVLFDLAELHRHQELFREAGELHQRVLAIKAAELGRSHPTVAKSIRALGQIFLGEGKLDQATSYLERALEHQSDGLGSRDPELTETLFGLGDAALASLEFEIAEEHYRRALSILEEHFGEKDIRTAKAWTSLAKLYGKKEQWSRAQPLLGRAVESVESVLGPSHLDVADLLEKSATVYLVSGAHEEAAEPIERALLIREDKLGAKHPSVARVLKLQGDYHSMIGDVTVARRLYSRADGIICDYHGAESAARFEFRLPLATSLRHLEEYEQAEAHLTTLFENEAIDDSARGELLKTDIQEELARCKLAVRDTAAAELLVKELLDVRSQRLEPQSEGVASAFECLAMVHHQSDRAVTASALAERALAARTGDEMNLEGRASNTLGKVRTLLILAQLELEQEGTVEAADYANQALNYQRDLMGEGHPEVASILHFLGVVAQAESRLETAESYYEEALEKWESFYGGSHNRVFKAVRSLAKLYQQQGRLTLAEQFHQRNLVALEGRYGAEHPILASTLLGLGRLCRSQGSTSLAEKYLKRAAEIQTAEFGDSDLRVATVLHTLALVYHDQRNFLAAEALLKKARDIRAEGDLNEEELEESHLALARLYRGTGKFEEAEPLFKEVLDSRSSRHGDDNPEVAAILREMAELYADQNELLKAQTLVRRAIDIFESTLGEKNLELVGPHRQLARLLELSGDVEQAEEQRALAQQLTDEL